MSSLTKSNSNVTSSAWKKRQTSRPSVTVVILSFNTADITRRCLEAVSSSRGVELNIVVVDNASTDRSAVSLARKYRLRKNHALLNRVGEAQNKTKTEIWENLPFDYQEVVNIRTGKLGRHQLHLVELHHNIGFGRANNLGMALVPASHYLFLNSDAFVKPHTILNLVKSFKTNAGVKSQAVLGRFRQQIDNVGIAAAQLYNQDKTIQVQGGSLPNLLNIFLWITFLDDIPFINKVWNSYQHHLADMRSLKRKKIAKVGWVGGTSMMISRSCLEEIGGFDPRIFMYGEDIELCWRATRRHWDVVLVEAGKVVHLGSASSDSHQAIVGEIKGLKYLWSKHTSQTDFWFFRQILLFGIRLRIIIFGILARYGRQRAYQEALDLV